MTCLKERLWENLSVKLVASMKSYLNEMSATASEVKQKHGWTSFVTQYRCPTFSTMYGCPEKAYWKAITWQNQANCMKRVSEAD